MFSESAYFEKEPKGRHWVPVLILVLLFSIGTVLFFLLPSSSGQYANGLTDSAMPWFTAKKGVLSFNASKYTGTGELSVPETIYDMPITAISDGCFEDCTDLTAIYLPETLEAIGENAFRGCSSLRGISIPKGVTFIGRDAFYDCTALEAVEISDHVRRIGSGAFGNCTKLKYVFYSGEFSSWAELYSENIGPDTTISCEDGIFSQSDAG